MDWGFDRPEPYYWSKAVREKNILNFLGPLKRDGIIVIVVLMSLLCQLHIYICK